MASDSFLPVCTFIVCCIIPYTSSTGVGQDTVIIDTPSGKIKGVKTVSPGNVFPSSTVYQFRKVPYAKPPLQHLRFSIPEPFGKWEGELDATEFGPSCIQVELPFMSHFNNPNKEFSEDCLFLNIYVPHTLAKTNRRPVMIWIHGGGFMFGNGAQYLSSTLSAFGDVILVTLNYRLGLFGFFSLGNEDAPGNYGLWDQKLAFEWVHNNIASFGGDPNSVTIFGESSGGLSVGLHSLIPSNKGLFQRIITQGGTIHVDFALSETAHLFSKSVGESIGCKLADNDKGQDFMDCMRNKSTQDLFVGYLMNFPNPTDVSLRLVMGPVIDGKLLQKQVSSLLTESDTESRDFFSSLDFMGGSTSHEGSILFLLFAPPQIQEKYQFNLTEGIPRNVFCEALTKPVVAELLVGSEEVAMSVCEQYTSTSSPWSQSMRAVEMIGDLMFIAPTLKAANYHSTHSRKSNTYMYIFSRQNEFPLLSTPSWFRGSGHGEDVSYVFGFEMEKLFNREANISSDDIALSKAVMRYWTNFAKTGSPNKPYLETDIMRWAEYDKENQRYIDLDLSCTEQSFLSSDLDEFWLQKIPDMIKNVIMKRHSEL